MGSCTTNPPVPSHTSYRGTHKSDRCVKQNFSLRREKSDVLHQRIPRCDTKWTWQYCWQSGCQVIGGWFDPQPLWCCAIGVWVQHEWLPLLICRWQSLTMGECLSSNVRIVVVKYISCDNPANTLPHHLLSYQPPILPRGRLCASHSDGKGPVVWWGKSSSSAGNTKRVPCAPENIMKGAWRRAACEILKCMVQTYLGCVHLPSLT